MYQMVRRIGGIVDVLKAYEGGHAPVINETLIEPLEVCGPLAWSVTIATAITPYLLVVVLRHDLLSVDMRLRSLRHMGPRAA